MEEGAVGECKNKKKDQKITYEILRKKNEGNKTVVNRMN